MLLKFPTTKTHFTFSAPAAQLIAAEMSQAHEQRTLFYLKGLGRFFIFISTSLPCGAQKKKQDTKPNHLVTQVKNLANAGILR